jgi:hypothetical protein
MLFWRSRCASGLMWVGNSPTKPMCFCCDSLCTALLKLPDSGREPARKSYHHQFPPSSAVCIGQGLRQFLVTLCRNSRDMSNSRSKALSEPASSACLGMDAVWIARQTTGPSHGCCCLHHGCLHASVPLLRRLESCGFDVSSLFHFGGGAWSSLHKTSV